MTQILGAVEPQTKTQSSAAALVQATPWPWLTAQVTQIKVFLGAARPSDALIATGCNPDPGIYVALAAT